jgi:hypothetical protein
VSIEALEAFDSHAPLRNALRAISRDKDEWAGIPMPLENQPLVIEPTYPRAAEIALIGQAPPEPKPPGYRLRNIFWSSRKRGDVIVWNEHEKLQYGLSPGYHHFTQDLCTLGASDAWGLEQEASAIQLLATLLRHRQFKQYLLTGMFLETSERSGVAYCFRKLRPTVAISYRGPQLKILCAMCLHPIGYYSATWAGVMAPTDDVIAHLMLMRGDEHMFWKRSNQHPAFRPEAGL